MLRRGIRVKSTSRKTSPFLTIPCAIVCVALFVVFVVYLFHPTFEEGSHLHKVSSATSPPAAPTIPQIDPNMYRDDAVPDTPVDAAVEPGTESNNMFLWADLEMPDPNRNAKHAAMAVRCVAENFIEFGKNQEAGDVGVLSPPQNPKFVPPVHSKVTIVSGKVFKIGPSIAVRHSDDVNLAALHELRRILVCDFGAEIVANADFCVFLSKFDVSSVEHMKQEEAAQLRSVFSLSVLPSIIKIGADTPSAVFYAMNRLRNGLMHEEYTVNGKLLRRHVEEGSAEVRCATIPYDGGRHSWRGLLIDSARHYIGVPAMKRVMWAMSQVHLNVLHWHLTDDQGWRIDIKSFPELARVGGKRGKRLNPPTDTRYNSSVEYPTPMFYSATDLREIVAAAAIFHIHIVPEIDFPAHTAALLRSLATTHSSVMMEELGRVEIHEGCASEPAPGAVNCMGGTHGMLLPTTRAQKIAETIVNEIISLFPDVLYIHIGGDEADEFRDKVYSTPRGIELKKEMKVTSPHELQVAFLNSLAKNIVAKRKTPVIWDDTFFGSSLDFHSEVEKEAVMMWWRDWSPTSRWERVRQTKYKKVLAPTSNSYLDFFQTEQHSDSKYNVQHGTVTLRNVFDLEQYGSVDDITRHGILGVEACLWSETLVEEAVLQYQLFPRVFALGHAAWRGTTSHSGSAWEEFLHNVQHLSELYQGKAGFVVGPVS